MCKKYIRDDVDYGMYVGHNTKGGVLIDLSSCTIEQWPAATKILYCAAWCEMSTFVLVSSGVPQFYVISYHYRNPRLRKSRCNPQVIQILQRSMCTKLSSSSSNLYAHNPMYVHTAQ